MVLKRLKKNYSAKKFYSSTTAKKSLIKDISMSLRFGIDLNKNDERLSQLVLKM